MKKYCKVFLALAFASSLAMGVSAACPVGCCPTRHEGKMSGGVTGKKYCLPNSAAFNKYSSSVSGAFSQWKSKTGGVASFTKVTVSSNSKIDFNIRNSSTGEWIGHPAKTKFYIPDSGEMTNDPKENWSYAYIYLNEYYFTSYSATNQKAMIAHEIGHALGVDHATHKQKSVMGIDLNWQTLTVQTNDGNEVKKIYQ